MRKLDLDAIKARTAAASDGPWAATSEPGSDAVDITSRGYRIAELGLEVEQADAAFIAYARQDVPALCDEVERLTRELDEARALVRKATNYRTCDEDEVIEAMQRWDAESSEAAAPISDTSGDVATRKDAGASDDSTDREALLDAFQPWSPEHPGPTPPAERCGKTGGFYRACSLAVDHVGQCDWDDVVPSIAATQASADSARDVYEGEAFLADGFDDSDGHVETADGLVSFRDMLQGARGKRVRVTIEVLPDVPKAGGT